MDPLPRLNQCWSKTDRLTQTPCLSIVDHCINVGAVGKLCVERLPSNLLCNLPQGASTLIALHDVGKVSVGFQLKCPNWGFFDGQNIRSEGNHAKVSQSYFSSVSSSRNVARWGIALGGHHGRYFSSRPRFTVSNEQYKEWADDLRHQLKGVLTGYFGALPSGDIEVPSNFQIHWFTGLITFADWIGSNEDFFPNYNGLPLDDRVSIEQAEQNAEKALVTLSLDATHLSKVDRFEQIFPFSPNALQKALCKQCDSQGLYLVEATMGLGKTEAALAAANIRWQSGEERGIYFALPTQLTSNRIFIRIKDFLDKTVQSSNVASLVHSGSWLNQERSYTINASNSNSSESDFSEAELWFNSSRTAMLATFGVGTIDQALMAVLSVKYSSLRFYALAGKVVVLDEVHSYDPYSFTLVCRLVKELIEIGSSVVILSATLTNDSRRELVVAAGGGDVSLSPEYPLLTSVKRLAGSVSSVSSIPVPTETQKKVDLTHYYLDPYGALPSDVIERISIAVAQGACVLIVRNTVKAAQHTYLQLKSELRIDDVAGLLHSRFPQYRREEIEEDWVGKLEKSSNSRPKGCVLVSTQIVEQSVDIDADLLITDLAPTELILQRMGRLHRHDITRPNGFETAQCWIIHPILSEGSDKAELRNQIGPSAFIYPPSVLVRSSVVLAELNCINLPNDIRGIIEKSNDKSHSVSPAHQALADDLDQKFNEMRDTGAFRTSNPLDTCALQDDEQRAQTRWGMVSTVNIILIQEKPKRGTTNILFVNGQELEVDQNRFDFNLAKELNKNSIKIPQYLLKGIVSEDWLSRYFFNDAYLCVLSQKIAGGLEVIGIDTLPDYTFNYHFEVGLRWEKCIEMDWTVDEDDSWF